MLPERIVVFGGSSVAGVGDSEGSGFIGRLKQWHESQNFRNILYNLGISGDTTTGMAKRLIGEASIRKPNLIIISTGANDTRRMGSATAPCETTSRDFKNNIHTLIAQSKSLCDVLFVSAYPVDEKKSAPLTFWHKDIYYFLKDLSQYQQYVKEICEAEKVPYCDVFNEWIKEDYQKWLTEDGLHANSEGHKKVFNFLKDFINI